MPDADEFARIIEASLGRAVRMARHHRSAVYREAILNACLHNTVFDPQVEDSKAVYLLDLIRSFGDEDWYRDRILTALAESSDDRDAEQLFDLAELFAKSGDSRAREVMYERFAANTLEDSDTGATQIVRLDGLDGFLFVTDILVCAAKEESEAGDFWFGDYLLSMVEERLGEEETARALQQAEIANANVAEYLAGVRAYRDEQAARQSERERDEISYSQIKRLIREPSTKAGRFSRTIEDPSGRKHRIFLPGWGRRAREGDLISAAADLLQEEDRERLEAYLRIFRNRQFPLPHDRIISLVTDDDEELASAALNVLSNITDRSVRDLALKLVEAERFPAGRWDLVVALLARNYQPGDYSIIERLLRTEQDQDKFHWLGMDVMDVFEANPLAEGEESLLMLYERGRCTLSRERSVELLHGLGLLPEWMLEECHYDANFDLWAKVQEWQDNRQLTGNL